MPAKSARRFVALVAIAVIAFGQFATTAFACLALPAPPPAVLAQGATSTDAGDLPCADGHPAPVSAQGNRCEVHCTDGITVPSQSDLPPVVLHALPVLAVPLAALGALAGPAPESIAPVSGAPPLALQFCRLLI
ncbi:MAG: hypothetical protein ABI724_12545 [Betaproteobacteria bacterium]